MMRRKLLYLPTELIEAIEEFRRRQRPLPSEAEAIRELIRRGLRASGNSNERRERQGTG